MLVGTSIIPVDIIAIEMSTLYHTRHMEEDTESKYAARKESFHLSKRKDDRIVAVL